MNKLEDGALCYLHKGSDSKQFKFGSDEYKAAIEACWVSDRAEAKKLFKEEVARKAILVEKEKAEEEELEKMVSVDCTLTYASILEIEVIGKNGLGNVVVRVKGSNVTLDGWQDDVNSWEIKKETFEASYMEVGSKTKANPAKEDKTLFEDDEKLPAQEENKDEDEVRESEATAISDEDLSDMSLTSLRKLAKSLDICCMGREEKPSVIKAIKEKIGK